MRPRYGNCITDEVTEIPRCCSRRIQSEVAWRAALRPLTVPAIWMAPPKSSSFSVRVVLPASGCEMIANVLRRLISLDISESDPATFPHHVHKDRLGFADRRGFDLAAEPPLTLAP